MTRDTSIRAVVFDLGGVLLDLNDPVAVFGVDFDRAEFNRRWLLSTAVQTFERGDCDAASFAGAVVREMGFGYGPDEFIERFNAWPGGIFPYAPGVVQAIAPEVDVGILSNTNGIHWESFGVERTFGDRIGRYFLSYQTGLVKPHADAFEQLTKTYGCEAAEILYFDDNPLNVDAAAALGFRAALGRDEAELREPLAALGLLDVGQRAG
ncbi:MAG: HAD-IA family hydrolase [Gammaproteobacteria bacterium]|nr:HAD-IA family hydrolase [Gammaproteobacteria bacterium]MDH4253429.1 HAD-IA family hydrolase [Gammaproteobacteria bacterium]MDH5309208.1 HAD-IA family hydrolase [Gammaproteobacteria bacterium]